MKIRSLRAWLLMLSGMLVACGHQDGVVGVAQGGDSAVSAPTAGGGTSLGGFIEEFWADEGRWESQTRVAGAATAVAVANPQARDGHQATLTFPGHPEYAAKDGQGPDFATQLSTVQRFHFGTYRTRLAFGRCDAREEAVQAFSGYFDDQQDHDGDGIIDDLEINVQVTCSAPSRIYLTVFTDYQETLQGTEFRKLSRVIDFATGDVFDTPSSDADTFTVVGPDTSLVSPSVFAADALYELGFEWHADSIRFFLTLGSSERNLWQLSGAGRVPQQPLTILYNVWHPQAHWFPGEDLADYPANDVVMSIDWLSYVPE